MGVAGPNRRADIHRLRHKMLVPALAAAVASVLPAASATAAPVARTFVTMFSDPGDYIGQGQMRVFYPSNGSISVSGTTSYLTVSVSGGTDGDSFGMTFAAPPGKRLHAQLYTGAQRAPFREAGRSGIDIGGSGRGCNEIGGRFDVHDIATDADGNVKRLWIVYEQHCENGVPALFGEVRFAEPESAGGFSAASESLWFPNTPVGDLATVVPVTVLAAGEVTSETIQDVHVAGLHAGDFQIRVDACTGVPLATHEACQVLLRFGPSVAGPRVARLVITDANGKIRQVALDGFGIGGTTSLTMDSDPGDWVGDGLSYAYDQTDATIAATGDWNRVSASIDGDNGDWWNAVFDAPQGDVLAPGTTFTNVTRYPFNGSGPGMSVSGNGRGCNTITGQFTVNDMSVTADGILRHFSIDFEQHCDGEAPALRGTLLYRFPSGDSTPPPAASSLGVLRSGRSATISWINPSSDFTYVVVRFSQWNVPPGLPNAGTLAYAGTGTSAVVSKLFAGKPLAVAVYTVDTAGNVGSAAKTVAP